MTPPDSKNPLPDSLSIPGIPPLGAAGVANLATLFALQVNAAGALAAAGQKMLEGMREISQEQMMLQSAFLRHAMSSWAGLANPGPPDSATDERARQASAATDATLDSMRRIVNAACRCSMDALGAFQQHMNGTHAENSGAPTARTTHDQRDRSAA
jgi:hypothetical protein